MTAEQIRELINRDVDGDLSPSERRQLAQALRRNASARRLQTEIRALAASLSSVRHADPPANLGNRIRAEVRSRANASLHPAGTRQSSASPGAPRSWMESLRAFVRTPSAVRYGAVFAGGLVCGAFLFMFLIHPPGVSGESASGTLLSHTETFPVNVPGAQGMFTAVPTENGKELTFRLTCGAATTTRLTYDPSRVKLENVREVQTAGGPVVVNEGVVEMTGTGVQRCTLTFSGVKDSRVAVQVATTGGGTFHADVQVH